MIKYFTIAAQGLTREQEQSLVSQWARYGWWHGVGNFWIFRDHTDTFTAPTLRDAVRKVAPNAKVMVIEVAPSMWAGVGMGESNREWLRKYFPPEGS